ncbi:hypothetical protein D9X91_10435 [Falsibacillus albus]|uniref:Uncharacterized protein n=1 Tax=Falsibacillus albus TaxID=2478915 RepID=A0A3L7JYU8_9BACI|nr:hypothetical protein D9X91_10435 [Falsibacillus albus]
MSFLSSGLNIQGLKINKVGGGCVFNTGTSHISRKFSSIKRNEGFGEQNADYVECIFPIYIVEDGDEFDSGSSKVNYSISTTSPSNSSLE